MELPQILQAIKDMADKKEKERNSEKANIEENMPKILDRITELLDKEPEAMKVLLATWDLFAKDKPDLSKDGKGLDVLTIKVTLNDVQRLGDDITSANIHVHANGSTKIFDNNLHMKQHVKDALTQIANEI